MELMGSISVTKTSHSQSFYVNVMVHHNIVNIRNCRRQNKLCIVVHKGQRGINGNMARLIIGFLTLSHITKIKRPAADS